MSQSLSPHQVAVSVGNGEDHSAATTSSNLKRKRPSTLGKEERKKVSRACDACKDKKVRCAGTQPCPRCHKHSLVCTYNKIHKRGRPATPEPGVTADRQQVTTVKFSTVPQSQEAQMVSGQQNEEHHVRNPSQDVRISTRSSLEADPARLEGDYIGPTSGISLLFRAQKRFHQDFAAMRSKSSEVQGSKKVSVYSFGDGWIPDYSHLKLVLPSRTAAKNLLDRYFNFAMPTYRFVQRPVIDVWLDQIYATTLEGCSLSNAKKAVVILIMATACLYHENATDPTPDASNKQSEESGMLFAEAERLLLAETGPVRIESVQARLAQCIHLLASSRINKAWYTFGTATQMISALGLHRKVQGHSSDNSDFNLRKRVFWSAYTLDLYLSVILGRPRIFRDEDIDQSLSETSGKAKNDMSLGNTVSQSVSEGPIFHARLAKILGSLSSDLYPASRVMETDWAESAERWTTELKRWKESLPPFLDPAKVDPSMLVPIFQRQSTVLRLAYAHAMILANRPALLSSFADLRRSQDTRLGEPIGSLKECIDAALEVVVTVNLLIEAEQMRKAFWFTHYISFCAISALYVYTIQQCTSRTTPDANAAAKTRYFDAATKCQERIESTTTATSPFRRYNIILDELKKEVLHHLSVTSTSAAQKLSEKWQPIGPINSNLPKVMDSSGGTPLSTLSNSHEQQPQLPNFPHDLQSLQNDNSDVSIWKLLANKASSWDGLNLTLV